jgi:hypothetical protein
MHAVTMFRLLTQYLVGGQFLFAPISFLELALIIFLLQKSI